MIKNAGAARLLMSLWSLALAGLTACGGGSGSSNPAPTNPASTNQAPTANAGTDQTVTGGVVTLSGAGTDSDGTIASYAWTQTAGPAVSLSSATAATPTFTTPLASSAATFTFSLVVTDNSGTASAADTVTITVQAAVAVTGKIRFARVPFFTLLHAGLDYNNEQQVAARDITVQAINATSQQVLSTAVTNSSGDYSLIVPQGTSVAIQAVAIMGQFRVRDIETMDNPYVYTGPTFNSGSAASVQNIDIPSGWDAFSRTATGTRASAPFAILDTVAKARDLILSVAVNTQFPVLTLDWAPTNSGFQTFYNDAGGGDNRVIVLAGEPNVDTDEFDEHVIAHEFGHYIEDRFSRSDSIGGPHAPGDRLDPRVAFGEGFGYAFGAIVLNDPGVRDSFGANQNDEGFFSVELDSSNNEGWYSEASSQEVLWDLFDSAIDGPDNVALGFAPLWQVLTTDQRTTDAMTSIFSFIEALKVQQAGLASGINAIVNPEMMVSGTMNAFATTETNAANTSAGEVLPVYKPISIGGGPQVVKSVANFGDTNKLSNHRFLRLDVGGTQSVRITATSGTVGRDVDIAVLRRGAIVQIAEVSGNEDFTLTLQPGTYVLDAYDCGNAGCGDNSPAAVNIAVTVVSN